MNCGARQLSNFIVTCFRPLESKVKVRQTTTNAGVLRREKLQYYYLKLHRFKNICKLVVKSPIILLESEFDLEPGYSKQRLVYKKNLLRVAYLYVWFTITINI